MGRPFISVLDRGAPRKKASAMAASEHLLVVLPGITGSALQKNGADVWGLNAGSILNGLRTGGESIESLALGVDKGLDLGDGVSVAGLVDTLHLVPGLWKIDGYTALQKMLRKRFVKGKDENYLPFAYDWRRDNAIIAEKLKIAVNDKLKKWRETSPNAKLILIAHSMGGLVCRYYLEVLGGWRETKALITFGTPYRGSMNAVRALENGLKIGIVDLSATARTFTALYQLLPTWECIDVGGQRVMIDKAASVLKHIDPKRAAEALDFHNRIETAQKANANDEAYRDHGYKIFPILGVKQPTLQLCKLDKGVLTFAEKINTDDSKGDGTVPRFSARPSELGDMDGMFCADRHGSIQNVEEVLTHVEGLVAGAELKEVRATVVELSVTIEDLYSATHGVEIFATPSEAGQTLRATVEDLDAGGTQTFDLTPEADGRQELKVDLKAGAYRIRIAGDEDVHPVTDTFVVEEA